MNLPIVAVGGMTDASDDSAVGLLRHVRNQADISLDIVAAYDAKELIPRLLGVIETDPALCPAALSKLAHLMARVMARDVEQMHAILDQTHALHIVAAILSRIWPDTPVPPAVSLLTKMHFIAVLIFPTMMGRATASVLLLSLGSANCVSLHFYGEAL